MSDELAGGTGSAGESAPSPSAAESTPTTIDGALDQAFDDLTAPPAEPVAATPAAPAGEVPTTAEPPAGEPPPGLEGKKGPIPFDVHDTALKNARQKAAEEAEQRFQQQYGGALQVVQALQADLPGTLAQLLAEASAHPEYGQAVTAHAARLLAGKRGAKPAADADPEPPRFADGPNGELIFDPAVDKQWREWNDRRIEKQLLAKVEEQYAPIKQSYEDTQKQREAAKQWAQYETQVKTRAKERGQEWDAMPFMEKDSPTRTAILKRQGELYEALKAQAAQGQRRMNPHEDSWIALQQAYREVVKQQGLPSLQAKTQQQFVESAVTKSRGSQSDPAASAPAQPRKARTVDEALDQAFSGIGA
jgi:hypothetical protein